MAPVSPNTAENSYTFLLWTVLLLETPSHKLYDGWRESVHLATFTMSKRTIGKRTYGTPAILSFRIHLVCLLS